MDGGNYTKIIYTYIYVVYINNKQSQTHSLKLTLKNVQQLMEETQD